MALSETGFIESLIRSEVRLHVARADGRILSTSACVDKIFKVYPKCWLPRRVIEDMIVEQASRAHVAVEIDEKRPRRLAVEKLLGR